MRLRIVIVAEARDGNARGLKAALKRLGCEVTRAMLRDCVFDTSLADGLSIPKLRGLPDAVIVRSMDAGSFEQVTRRLGILHALRELGVTVWNDARAIERCVDKSMTSFLLARHGIATPPTWTLESRKEAEALVASEAARAPLVLKPLFGSQGRGLKLVGSAEDLPPPAEVNGVYYLQRFVAGQSEPFHDFRVLVAGGRAVAAMRRISPSWITNVKQGGRPEPVPLDAELARLALAASRAVGADFCGVDVITPKAGPSMVLEVNSMPAWSGLQQVASVDIAHEIAAALVAAMGARARLDAAE